MSNFNRAYRKIFVGTFGTQAANPGVAAGVNNGLLTTTGVKTVNLKNTAAPFALGVGVYGFFNKDTFVSVDAGSADVTSGTPLVIASTSIFSQDMMGQFHGGYRESVKSKVINPRYISKWYKVEDAAPEQNVVHIGVTHVQIGFSLTFVGPCGAGYTPGTYLNVPTTTSGAGTGLTVDVEVNGAGEITSIVENQVGTGYVAADTITPDATTLGHDGVGLECTTTEVATVGVQECEFDFLCGETYNLFIQLNGAPVLKALHRDSYRTLAAYTGCCPEGTITPTAVDSTLVMISWANQIITDPLLKDFIKPVVFDESGNVWFATAADAVAEGYPAATTFADYVSAGHIDGATAGMRLIGAYVETATQNCSFQYSDGYEVEVVQIEAQLVDTTGNPCVFDGLCITTECCGFGGQGFGEDYLRQLIQSESYRQNWLSNDVRIREMNGGNDLRDALSRTLRYTKYVILHNVPRWNNDASLGTWDQYEVNIIVPSGVTAASLEALMTAWLTGANNPITLEEYGHGTPCTPDPLPTYVP